MSPGIASCRLRCKEAAACVSCGLCDDELNGCQKRHAFRQLRSFFSPPLPRLAMSTSVAEETRSRSFKAEVKAGDGKGGAGAANGWVRATDDFCALTAGEARIKTKRKDTITTRTFFMATPPSGPISIAASVE